MRIYILRHGDAEEGTGIPDQERPLTPEGKRKLRNVLGRARAGGAQPSIVLSSPLRRAEETARLAAEVLGVTPDVVKTRALLPEGRPEEVWDEIRVHKDRAEVMLAGHEPLLSRVAAHLAGAPSLDIEMRKAALARVDVERFGPAPRGVLVWLIPPEVAVG